MKNNIKSKSISITEAIRQRVEEKLEKLNKFYQRILLADIELELTTHHHNKGKIFMAVGNLDLADKLLRAEAINEDLYGAIDELFHKLKAEVIKYKDKKINN